MKNSIIIIAHGSPLECSNNEVRGLVKQLTPILNKHYQHIEVAFLDCATPTIADALLACQQVGSQQITIFNYFLVAGKHVRHDIPQIIEEFKIQYPNININDLGYLGQEPALLDFLSKTILQLIQ